MRPNNPSSKVADFRDLLVWQKSMDFVIDVYAASAAFPRGEQFGLTSQVRRAAVSIPSNLAEGNSRFDRGDYRRFVSFARGSTGEVYTKSTSPIDCGTSTRQPAASSRSGAKRSSECSVGCTRASRDVSVGFSRSLFPVPCSLFLVYNDFKYSTRSLRSVAERSSLNTLT
jgi:four helix bundle protein